MDIVAAPGSLVRDPVTRRVVSQTDPLTIDPLDLDWARLLRDHDILPAPATADRSADAVEPVVPAADSEESNA